MFYLFSFTGQVDQDLLLNTYKFINKTTDIYLNKIFFIE